MQDAHNKSSQSDAEKAKIEKYMWHHMISVRATLADVVYMLEEEARKVEKLLDKARRLSTDLARSRMDSVSAFNEIAELLKDKDMCAITTKQKDDR